MRDFLEDAEDALKRVAENPLEAVRHAARQSWPKRFFKDVDVVEQGDVYCVVLDGRPLKTPGKRSLAVTSQKVAALLASEWSAIEDEINPLNLPVTRILNTAMDGVADNLQPVAEDIVRYAGSDLLCYRADHPEGLVASQKAHWDPVLEWADLTLGASFETSGGIMHVAQPKEAIAAFSSRLGNWTRPIPMACLHTITSLTGSAILALAVAEKELSAETAWQAAHVDEDWNISQWGEDHEAAERRKLRWQDMKTASDILDAEGGR